MTSDQENLEIKQKQCKKQRIFNRSQLSSWK